MKKLLFLTFLLLAFNFTLNAQDYTTDKGIILIKGNSDFNLVLTKGSPIFLSLGGGYFLKENICLGADLILFGASGTNTVIASPFARYYFMEKFYAGASLIKGIKFGDKYIELEEYKAQINAGYMFYLNDYVVLEPNLKYPIIEDAKLIVGLSISIYY